MSVKDVSGDALLDQQKPLFHILRAVVASSVGILHRVGRLASMTCLSPIQGNRSCSSWRLERVAFGACGFQFFDLARLQWVLAFGLAKLCRVMGFTRCRQGHGWIAAKRQLLLGPGNAVFEKPSF